jgi:hypothetical protein
MLSPLMLMCTYSIAVGDPGERIESPVGPADGNVSHPATATAAKQINVARSAKRMPPSPQPRRNKCLGMVKNSCLPVE